MAEGYSGVRANKSDKNVTLDTSKLRLTVLILISLFCVTCQDKSVPKGKWEIADHSDTRLAFKQILFTDSLTLVFDQEGIEFKYEKETHDKSLVLRNKQDTITLTIIRIENTLLIDSIRFHLVDLNREDQQPKIELFNIPADDIPLDQLTSYSVGSPGVPRRLRCILKFYKNRIGKLTISYDGSNASLDDFYLMAENYRCQFPPSIIIDKSISYIEFQELVDRIKLIGYYRINVITNSLQPNEYQGFYHKIDVWEGDVERILTKNSASSPIQLPPQPLRQTKQDFINEYKSSIRIDKMDLSKIDSVKQALTQMDAVLVLAFDRNIPLEDYFKTRIAINRLIREERNRRALIKLNKEFVEVPFEVKRAIILTIPKIIYQ